MNGVVVEYSQYVTNGECELSKNPYFAIETRLRGCDSMVFRLPILESTDDANIAGFAIRPVVSHPLPIKLTIPPIIPTTHSSSIAPHTTSTIGMIPSELTPDPLTVEAISITSEVWNSFNATQFIIRGLSSLKSIVIGDECFGSVNVFEMDKLNQLESVMVGKNSVSVSGDCLIMNCPKLKSILIGDYSFPDYQSFELFNLPSLQSIDVGKNCFTTVSSFSLSSLNDPIN